MEAAGSFKKCSSILKMGQQIPSKSGSSILKKEAARSLKEWLFFLKMEAAHSSEYQGNAIVVISIVTHGEEQIGGSVHKDICAIKQL
jgi:hypothetical protein